MTELDDKIRDLSKIFAFQIMTHTIIVEERLTNIICMSITNQRTNIEKFLDYFERGIGLDSKIELTKVILECNHPTVLQKYPTIFTQIGQIKKWRNLLAHLNRHYEVDSSSSNAEFVLNHRKITKQERLTEKKMRAIMLMAEKCNSQMAEIEKLVAKEKGIMV